MPQIELSLQEEAGDVIMTADVSGIDEDTRLTFQYRESLLGEWEEVQQETITEDGEYTANVTLDTGTYSFKASLRQPPSGTPTLQLDSNIIAYIYDDEILLTEGYTTVERLQANLDIDEEEAEELMRTVTRWIDNYTKRTFISEPQTRLYDGNGRRSLHIGDWTDEILLETSRQYYPKEYSEVEDYIKLPHNYDQDDIPINEIHLENDWFVSGKGNVRITGNYGYSNFPPSDLIEAATRLAILLHTSSQTTAKGKDSESIGDYQVSYSDAVAVNELNKVKATLDSYKKYEL